MRFTIPIDELRKAPFVGPRGGLWADPQHTVTWDPKKHAATAPKFVIADHFTRNIGNLEKAFRYVISLEKAGVRVRM